MDNNKDLLTANFVVKCLRKWYWYIPPVLIALAIAQLLFMQASPVWTVTGSIVVEEEKTQTSQLPEETIITGLPFANRGSLNRQMQELKSRSLMEKVVDSLDLDVIYWKEGRFRDEELYRRSPVRLVSVSDRSAANGMALRVQLKSNSDFTLLHPEEDEPLLDGKFGMPFQYEGLAFTLQYDSLAPAVEGVIRIEIKMPREMAAWYSGKLQLRRLNQSNVLAVSIQDQTPEKLQDIIRMLVKVYNIVAQEEKNKVADKSLQFINDRLVSLNAELFSVEGREASVRSSTQVIADVGTSAERYFEQITTAQTELLALRNTKTTLLNMKEFLETESNRYEPIPNFGDIAGFSFAGLLTDYNNLVIQRKARLEHSTLQHPVVISMTNKIDDLRTTLENGIRLALRDLEKRERELVQQSSSLERQVQRTPFAEKQIKEISRQASVFQEIVLYMLKKREETAIGLATQVESARILDDPVPGSVPDGPSRTQYFAIALLVGLALPTGFFLLQEKLDTRVNSSDEVKALSKLPFLGEVALEKDEDKKLIKEDVRSINSEMFRIIRTNLHFLLPPGKDRIILITSNESGDGKTFVSGNLAATLAITQKRTIVLELDLRKPKLTRLLTGKPGTVGLTNYLVGDAEIEDIIHPVEGYESLYYISSGPTPPNPAELILNEKLDALFDYLRKQYEYIVVDTPPVTVVTDTFLLNRFASATVFVIRANKTKKEDLKNLDEIAQQGKLNSPAIILNGAKPSKRYGYYY